VERIKRMNERKESFSINSLSDRASFDCLLLLLFLSHARVASLLRIGSLLSDRLHSIFRSIDPPLTFSSSI